MSDPTQDLVAAVRDFLEFDNTIEHPGPDAPYPALVQWEKWKTDHTERMAAAAERLAA